MSKEKQNVMMCALNIQLEPNPLITLIIIYITQSKFYFRNSALN